MTKEQKATEKKYYRVKVINEAVQAATWSSVPALTLGTPVNNANSSQVLVSGVKAGVTYVLTCHLTGTSTQEYDPSVTIKGIK